jgi:hypothetical protein
MDEQDEPDGTRIARGETGALSQLFTRHAPAVTRADELRPGAQATAKRFAERSFAF